MLVGICMTPIIMVPRNLFRHLIPRMSRRGFLWGKLRQSRVLLSKQRLNLLLLLWLKLDTLELSAEISTPLKKPPWCLYLPIPYWSLPNLLLSTLVPNLVPRSQLPSIALELWWINYPVKGSSLQGFLQRSVSAGQNLPTTNNAAFPADSRNPGIFFRVCTLLSAFPAASSTERNY